MALSNRDKIVLRDVDIIAPFRNFSGKKSEYNAEGSRNFSIALNPEEAASMLEDGWNIKFLKYREGETPGHPTATARDGGPVGQAYLQIKVAYANKPPKITVITSRNMVNWDESVVENLDYVDIKKADVTITPFLWDIRGEKGVKAYLRTLYLTIDEDPLDLEYAEMREQFANARGISSGYEDDIIDGEVVDLRELEG